MRGWALLTIIAGISLGVGIALWIMQHSTTPSLKLLIKTPEEAIAALKSPFVPGSRPEFGFMKYNGSIDGSPSFIVYQADPDSGSLVQKEGSIVFHKGQYEVTIFKEEYLSKETKDRFVWILFNDRVPDADEFFLDAENGELIAISRGGGYCHGTCMQKNT